MTYAARRVGAPVATMLLLMVAAAAAGGDAPGSTNPASAIAAAAGHPALLHLRAEATVSRDGQTMTSTLDVAGSSRLERDCAGDLCHGSWFDGLETFAFGINGTLLHDREQDDRAARTFAAIASTAFAEPAFLARGGRVSVVPKSAAGSVRYRVEAPGGSPLIAVAGKGTERLVSVERPDGSVYATLVASGSPPVFLYGSRPYDHVASVAGSLGAPAGPAVQVAAVRETSLLPGPLPRVPCRLGGRDATCLIDSGTTPSAVTLAFAEGLGLEPHGAIEIAGLSSYVTGVVEAQPLVVGAASLTALHFAVVPHASQTDFDVILGSDALAVLRVELDSGRRRARIEADRPDPAASAVPVDFAAGLPYAEVRLGDRSTPESMLIDTGDTGVLSIGYDEYREDMSLFAARGHSVAGGVGSALMDTVDGEVAHADLGPLRFDRLAIAAVRGQHIGHVGYGIVARCGRFVLSLGRRQIECSAPAGNPGTPVHGQR